MERDAAVGGSCDDGAGDVAERDGSALGADADGSAVVPDGDGAVECGGVEDGVEAADGDGAVLNVGVDGVGGGESDVEGGVVLRASEESGGPPDVDGEDAVVAESCVEGGVVGSCFVAAGEAGADEGWSVGDAGELDGAGVEVGFEGGDVGGVELFGDGAFVGKAGGV